MKKIKFETIKLFLKNFKKTIILLAIILFAIIIVLNFRCEITKDNFIIGCEPPEKKINIEKNK